MVWKETKISIHVIIMKVPYNTGKNHKKRCMRCAEDFSHVIEREREKSACMGDMWNECGFELIIKGGVYFSFSFFKKSLLLAYNCFTILC